MEPVDRPSFLGRNPLDSDNVYVITGISKWSDSLHTGEHDRDRSGFRTAKPMDINV